MEAILKKDKTFIVGGIVLIAAISWYYMVYLDGVMKSMNMAFNHVCEHECCKIAGMPMTGTWTSVDFLLMLLMWTVMMVAMMLPSVAPLILLFASVNRKRKEQHTPYVSTIFFTAGYFFVWTAFSLGATFLQWLLQYLSLLSPLMITSNKWIGGSILLLAGLFQFSNFKYKCLSHCRSPLEFIMHHWKEGKKGAFNMGVAHGWYCLGCCWILMLVLFATGIMNLFWVAAIALFVLIEKMVPRYYLQISRIAGIILIADALWLVSYG